jgi:fatty-acyl-CoA synthase
MIAPKERVEAILRRYPSWESKTLGECFEDAVSSYGDREFIWTRQGVVTYREASEKVDWIATGLERIGVSARERVAIVMANYPEQILIRLALAMLGSVCVPINFRFRSHEWRHLLRESEASTLIVMDRFDRFDYMGLLRELCPEAFGGFFRGPSETFPHLKRVISFSLEGLRYEGMFDFWDLMEIGRKASMGLSVSRGVRSKACADDLCEIVYTYPSWDGGRPRGALITHDMLLRSSFATALSRAYPDGRRALFSVPFYHVYAGIEGLVSSFFVGGAVVLQLKFDPEDTLELIEAARATDLLLVPTMAISLLRHRPKRGYDLSSLKCAMCAGQAAPPGLLSRLKEFLGVEELTNAYGMTEVAASAMHTAPEDPPERAERFVGRIKPAGPSGSPLLHGKQIEYKGVDLESGEDLPPGREGEWVCRGLTVTSGFWGRPEETRASFLQDGWFRTGDLGIVHPDGYFELTGRCKNVYRIGGETVSPQEVEEVLLEHPKVEEACVVPVPDELFIEVGMAFLRLRQGQEATKHEIVDFLKARIARYKVPSYVRFVTEGDLPRDPSGRLDREALTKRGIEENGLLELAKSLGSYRTVFS